MWGVQLQHHFDLGRRAGFDSPDIKPSYLGDCRVGDTSRPAPVRSPEFSSVGGDPHLSSSSAVRDGSPAAAEVGRDTAAIKFNLMDPESVVS